MSFLDPAKAKTPFTRALREVGLTPWTSVFRNKLKNGGESIYVDTWVKESYEELIPKLEAIGYSAKIVVTHAGTVRLHFNKA